MGQDPFVAAAAAAAAVYTPVPGATVDNICLPLPSSSVEAFCLQASSPTSGSSTSFSSMSEIFAVAGLNESGQSSNPSENEAGENASVCSITYAPGTPFSANTDHGVSCASNIPSPIMEEEAGLWMNIDHVDHMPEDLELDVKPCLDGNCFPNSTSDCCRQDSSSDDMLVCRLEELLQAGTPRELVGDSGHTCVDDLFPSLSTGQDSPLLDAVGMWSVESLQDLEPLPFQEEEVVQPEPSYYGGEEENVSQMFAQWLRSNAHCISLSDLRKIKLKTSTIENATRRLGGGKKGLMLFVKFVLMWVQNCHMKQAVAEAVAASAAAEATQPREASLGFLGASAVTSGALEGQDLVGSGEGFGAAESCVVQSARSHPHTLYNGSTFSQLTIPSCTDNSWSTSKGRWTQTPNVEHNVAVPAANSFAAAATGGGCPLPFCRSEKPWLQQSSMLCGVSPSLRSPAVGANCLGASGSRDTTDMMMMVQQQQRRFDVTPAATTRAARKSRMERQRWSVRRNRKWSVAAHHLSSAASAAGADANLPSWTAAHDLPYNSRTYQRLARSGMDCQQGKKSERNLRLLFHKELKQSDVGNLGRIVLPKKAAETSLPPLELRDGVNLVVEDLNSSKVWNMRYRFWPNNKSRMYLLENTGDFVKSYDLKEGDYMMLYCNNLTNKYMIRGTKGERPSGGGFHAASNEPDQNGGIKKGSPGGGNIALATNSEESCDDSFLAELIEQSLEDIKDSSETEMSDLLK